MGPTTDTRMLDDLKKKSIPAYSRSEDCVDWLSCAALKAEIVRCNNGLKPNTNFIFSPAQLTTTGLQSGSDYKTLSHNGLNINMLTARHLNNFRFVIGKFRLLT